MDVLQQLVGQIGYDHWQDLVLSAGNVFFCITLIPMLRDDGRPPLLTCTGVALLAGGFIFATLHLWFVALTQTISGLQWLVVACKKPSATAPEADLRSCDAALHPPHAARAALLLLGRSRCDLGSDHCQNDCAAGVSR